ncbi:flavodoxin [Clostridium acetobutylicum]|uniref:Flavodoxin n=1 Tax=Clostridium acetobutylicum (strain ATCC 824 / DSM 792 / JCM 1419 / IAM 19013 / LMG 5710 / NBRC 13948 / NRRL B-527 / VKM B-1787 / 2291 / W) TaxID=272562 RepID=Q97DQ5_CLOAB|nr:MULTISPECIES: flavodoxin [Clostridium]AAK81347.1 Flavodoxin [Clostridium acetobutylicum ATCC 824]ADZ22458.1 Flavodoxin [Clostridium acetobutylicum EA 2018]AEI32835.1 flavodoxin [Clostridium acetobutylicum DSM 1731]AWV80985.1 flavodoxin [Clostridium acetobutylicum]MBC2395498.1 flavodoxin [Clostridium acetobutylicum]
MKSLIVFYSLEGHTKFIADIIGNNLGSDLLELKPEKEIPKTGFKKYFWGGKSAIFKEKPNLQNKIPSMDEYDTIIIGTPVWAGTYAPPINTFISSVQMKNKRIAFFACHGGGGAKKCFEKLEEALKGNTFIGEIEFKDPTENEREKVTKEIKDWITKYLEK